MSAFRAVVLVGTSLLAISTPAFAQDTANADTGVTEDSVIIVEARRRDEKLQDVPLTVNAVTADTLEKLNIRNFADVASVVPGLALEPGLGTVSSSASLRGVQVDTNTSGNNATVEFYMNDAPIGINTVLQSMYDIGQIEVLRGPQGTLRGRASPSGSITVTTRRPDMEEWGGYVMGTVTDIDTVNVNGAVNIPIAPGVFALRVAGLLEDTEANRVRSINAPDIEPESKTRAFRVSARFTPDSNLEVNGSYARLEKDSILFDQVESANLALGIPVVGTEIHAEDRLAVMNAPRDNHATYDVINLQARWSFAGQRLDYVGSHVKSRSISQEPSDKGDFWGPSFPGDPAASTVNLQNYGSTPLTESWQDSHELRLTSEERVAGMFDYVVGGFVNINRSDVNFTSRTPLFFAAPLPATFVFVNPITTLRPGRTLEQALFGNITAHIGEGTEISGGARHIWFKDTSSTNIVGIRDFGTTTRKHQAWVWTASVKHRFNENLMAYATAGSSWRVGVDTSAIILFGAGNNGITDPNLLDLTVPKPEKSKSYEIGLRTNWLDDRLTLNVSAFHQDFDNYLTSISSTYFAAYNGTGGYSVKTVTGLGVPVPAKVDGVEAEFAFRPSRNFNLSGNVAYARGRIKNGSIPCSPAGNPPPLSSWDTANGQQILFCTVNQRASKLAPFSASLQAEYSHEIFDGKEAFLRGLATYKGKSQNEPANPFDDVKDYALINLFAGVRAADGSWELTGFVKNVTNEKIVLTREATPFTANYLLLPTFTSGTGFSNYRGITVTAPREFGVTFRYAIGSR